jgi:single-strand DNA-binding protein
MIHLRATGIGNLTKDAEIKDLNGKKCVTFSLASNKKDRDGKETTEYYDCFLYREKTGIAQYLTKGKQIYIEGDINVAANEYKGKTYINKNVTVHVLEFCGGKAERQEPLPASYSDMNSAPTMEPDDDNLPF